MSKLDLVTFLVVAMLVSFDRPVAAGCYHLVKQYYECAYAIMDSFSDPNFVGGFYQSYKESASSYNNDKLDDGFFKQLGLLNMSFDEAMNFFKSIYDEITDCSTEFCKCVNSVSTVYGSSEYDVFFQNVIVFQQVKSIVANFIDAYRPYLLPSELIFHEWSELDTDQQVLPTLNEFCIRNEFTANRLRFYNLTESCLIKNQSVFDACEWSASVSNRSVILNPTNEQLEQQMICYMLSQTNCPADFQRFYALLIWALKLPSLKLSSSQQQLVDHIDSLSRRAALYTPSVLFDSVYLTYTRLYPNVFSVKSYANVGLINYLANSSSFNLQLLDSKKLRIDCKRLTGSKKQTQLGPITLTFSSAASEIDNRTKNLLTLKINNYSSPNLKNAKIIQDKTGTNVFQVFIFKNYLHVFDFNTNSSIWVSKNEVYLTSPRSFLESASGILIDGFEKSQNNLNNRTNI